MAQQKIADFIELMQATRKQETMRAIETQRTVFSTNKIDIVRPGAYFHEIQLTPKAMTAGHDPHPSVITRMILNDWKINRFTERMNPVQV